ncbi:MAG TPA: YeeE/YedE family protein [Devosia sp.]|nr:YeeE/YedE family protein [Devosia sp.]
MSREIKYLLTAAVSGLLFGAGLYVSQMIDPMKVLHFLDFGAIPAGGWDPSLAFVMGGGVVVMFIAVRLARLRTAPLFDVQFHDPEFRRIDTRLVAGAALFGVGWGMAGICPGPAISLIAFWPDNLLVYLAALFAGSYAGAVIMPSGHDKRLAVAR